MGINVLWPEVLVLKCMVSLSTSSIRMTTAVILVGSSNFQQHPCFCSPKQDLRRQLDTIDQRSELRYKEAAADERERMREKEWEWREKLRQAQQQWGRLRNDFGALIHLG